ncbi:NAD(P)/FAD-dependent oxidoreductase [Roseovarius sp. E0-M6]|uniref:NAD(P)/FAD-dependent oxidoreductase n=1 Tax=Roseovarius sp. E0-M6 TaxID=3127118 RepID=UPI00300F911D
MIANETPDLADALWTATARKAPDCPPLEGDSVADVAVIGAGFTGLSAALHLAARRKRVVVLEAETPGWGASGRNGGQINPGLKLLPEDVIARAGRAAGERMVATAGAAPDLVFELIQRYGIFCDAVRTGFLRAAHVPRAMQFVTRHVEQWQARGVAVEPLNAEAIRAHLGGGDYVGGYLDPRGGKLHPLNYALGLAEAAIREGAAIYGQTRVLRREATGGAHRLVTARGTVRAQRVIIATNGYSDDVAPIVRRSVVPVTSVQVATAPLADDIRATILPGDQTAADTRRLLYYFRLDAEGRFLMGGRGGLSPEENIDQQAKLRVASLRLFPQLADADWAHAWGGSVAVTPDGLPQLNEIAPGVIAGLGYNGIGVAMGTAMGRVMADWATGTAPEALDFPMTPAKAIPFHGARRTGIRLKAMLYRRLDARGL